MIVKIYQFGEDRDKRMAFLFRLTAYIHEQIQMQNFFSFEFCVLIHKCQRWQTISANMQPKTVFMFEQNNA